MATNLTLDLKTSVSYAAGSIVSRELLRTKGGTITAFAFDAGQGLSEHTAPFDVMLHVLDGEAVVSISGKKHVVPSGRMIILPAGKPHSVAAKKRFKMLLTMLRA